MIVCEKCGRAQVEVWFLAPGQNTRNPGTVCRDCRLMVAPPAPAPQPVPTLSQIRAAAQLCIDPVELARRAARDQKYCTGCAKWLRSYRFPRSPGRHDGRHPRCKSCVAWDMREHRKRLSIEG